MCNTLLIKFRPHKIFFPSTACNQAGLGVAAIFGPKNHDIAGHINSMCNTLEIPHIEVRLEPHTDEYQLFSMNLFPDTTMLSRAYMDLLKQFKWEKFVVIYGNQNGKQKDFVIMPGHILLFALLSMHVEQN